MTMETPRLDSGVLQTSLTKAATAHAAIKSTIQEHAAAATEARIKAHDKLHADNIAAHKS